MAGTDQLSLRALRRSLPLYAAVAISVALHAGLWKLVRQDPAAAPRLLQRQAPATHVFRWRVVMAAPPAAITATPVPAAASTGSAATPSPAFSAPLLPAAGGGQHQASLAGGAAPAPPRDASAQGEALAVPVAPQAASPVPSPGYRSAAEVTESPRPPVGLEFPPPPPGVAMQEQTGVFTLFVEEDGSISQAVIDGPTLSPPLEALARETLLAAQFTPGKVAGRPVRSFYRIEVTFGAAQMFEMQRLPPAQLR